MIVYRIARQPYTALDGEGARLYGGRWNSPGRPMLYTAASPSLAVLEVMVHLDLPAELLPTDYRLLTIEIPDEAPVLALPVTPDDPGECVRAGDAFLAAEEALVMTVPSVIVGKERNALINPSHPAAAQVRLAADDPFTFDPRLLGGAA